MSQNGVISDNRWFEKHEMDGNNVNSYTTFFYHETQAGDVRKLANESADASSGGGARDLRQNAEEFQDMLCEGIFTELSTKTSSNGTVYKAPGLDLHFFPPTDARPNETRMSRISDVVGWRGANEGDILVLTRTTGQPASAFHMSREELGRRSETVPRAVLQRVREIERSAGVVRGVFTILNDSSQEQLQSLGKHPTPFTQNDQVGAVLGIHGHQDEDFDVNAALNEEVGYEVALRRSRPGQTPFRNALIRSYGPRCLVTGTVGEEVIEAAHIIDAGGGETMHPRNGLLLRRDIHRLWDLGLLKIHPDTLEIQVDPNLDEEYTRLDGERLQVDTIGPDRDALEWKYNQ